MDRGVWQAVVHEVTESNTHEWAQHSVYVSPSLLTCPTHPRFPLCAGHCDSDGQVAN